MPMPRKRENAICLSCEAEFEYLPSRSTGKYCSNQCQADHRREKYISEWKAGLKDGSKSGGNAISNHVRHYLLEQVGHKCPECGWDKVHPITGKVPLQIDHINGNSKDNSPENLRVLCPNCHSLTETFGALNAGNGSKERLKYFKLQQGVIVSYQMLASVTMAAGWFLFGFVCCLVLAYSIRD